MPLHLIPFLGILISIAFGPNVIPKFWHKHENKIIFFWSIIALLTMIKDSGLEGSLSAVGHMLGNEYIPFVTLIGSLYIITNGLKIDIKNQATPLFNVIFMFFGCLLSNLIGTTGAAMLLIRPLLQANRHQKDVTHLVFFFILSVANIGGCLTPIGDPPLFLGYLNGVNFEWPFFNLWHISLLCVVYLLMLVWIIDFSKQSRTTQETIAVTVSGKIHILFLFIIVMAIFLSGKYQGYSFNGISSSILRDVTMVIASLSSLIIQKKDHINQHWGPLSEVTRVFIGIFLCLIPASTFLGTISFTGMTSDMYFWLTGALSSIFDNAPTYLFFFKLAGGNADVLMAQRKILMAISAGAVFFGALTYIGNAPNFMINSIAKQHGINMPSFAKYMMYAMIVLLPIFIVVDWLFIH